MKIIGDKKSFAFEIGDCLSHNPTFRAVDIWAGGRRLCLDDTSVYAGQFVASLKRETSKIYEIRLFEETLKGKTPEEMAHFVCSTREEESPNHGLHDDSIFPAYNFLNLGPTTDNIRAFLFRQNTGAHLVYSLWREDQKRSLPMRFHVVALDFDFVMSVLHRSIDILENEKAEPSASASSSSPRA